MRASAQQTDPEMRRQAGAAAVGQQDGNGLLEPCAVKVACTVLRGGMGSNAHPLPEKRDQGRFLSRPEGVDPSDISRMNAFWGDDS